MTSFFAQSSASRPHVLIFQYAADGNIPAMKVLNKSYKDSVRWISEKDGSTLLMTAAANGQVSMINYLVEEAGAQVNQSNFNCDTALMQALFWDHLNAAKALLKCGANINAQNRYGDTALMTACRAGKVDSILFLLSNGADITIKNKRDRTPLDMLSLAISSTKREEIISAFAQRSRIPLKNVSIEELSILLSRSSLNATVQPLRSHGVSGEILSYCESVNDILSSGWGINSNPVAKALLADIQKWNSEGVPRHLITRDQEEYTLQLFQAQLAGIVEVNKSVAVLKSLMNDCPTNDFSIALWPGAENATASLLPPTTTPVCLESNALMMAAKHGLDDIVKKLLSRPEVKRGIDKKNADGDTALIIACRLGKASIIKLLMQGGANVGCTNNKFESAHSVAPADSIEIHNLLDGRSISPSPASKSHNTITIDATFSIESTTPTKYTSTGTPMKAAGVSGSPSRGQSPAVGNNNNYNNYKTTTSRESTPTRLSNTGTPMKSSAFSL